MDFAHSAGLNGQSRFAQQLMITHKAVRQVVLLTLFMLGPTVLFFVGCHSIANPRNLKSVSIVLKRTSCYGWCPVYTVSINGTGGVEYFGERFVDIPGRQTRQIPSENVKALLANFEKINFFELKDKYFETCTDMPTAIISIVVDGKTKEISNYYGGCERATSGPQVDLDALARQIDETAGTRNWVKCDFACLKTLIQAGLDVNSHAPEGSTLLMAAIQRRDLPKARLLLDGGAQVNAADDRGYTPLMYAGMMDHLEMVEELLARGADVNAKDNKGFTVLSMAGGQKVRQALMRASKR